MTIIVKKTRFGIDKFIPLIFVIAFVNGACTKLNEKFQGDLTQSQVAGNPSTDSALLLGIYNSLGPPFEAPFDVFPLSELSTDEAILPTRGGDWDDNGVWRALHEQKWDADNNQITQCFNDLGGVIFASTDILQYHPTVSQQAQARFIRAWAMFWMLDLFNQVPYREPGENTVNPAKVMKGTDALSYIINEINAIENELDDGPPYVANKYAAKALLMKCYLNKAVYVNRPNPVADPADMNMVIALSDSIIISNRFSFAAKYFDNFSPDNTDTSVGKENIFTQLNIGGITNNNGLFFQWLFVLHYAQGGINGAATLSDFYNKFEATDKRREAVYFTTGSPPNPGNRVNLGFLVGQQYDLTADVPLQYDNAGDLLIYEPQVKNSETGSDFQITGIRPLKYAIDYVNYYNPDNDYVYLRLSDVLLMKAEAIIRGGTPTIAGSYGSDPISIVNAIRTDPSRGASKLSSLSPDDLLDERGRELWWENWRRQDMIRFGKFLLPFQEKNYNSDPKYLLFPIPNQQLAVNPNLKQNPGY
jgi:starch-binding outer membrane protein, SusD/RagB family